MRLKTGSLKPLTERQHQIRLVRCARLLKIPLVHIANEGERSAKTTAILKLMGLEPGFPDCFAPLAHGGFFALFLEVKCNRKYTESEMKTKSWIAQDNWLIYLNNNNFFARRAFGWEHGLEILNAYKRWKPTEWNRRGFYDDTGYVDEN